MWVFGGVIFKCEFYGQIREEGELKCVYVLQFF